MNRKKLLKQVKNELKKGRESRPIVIISEDSKVICKFKFMKLGQPKNVKDSILVFDLIKHDFVLEIIEGTQEIESYFKDPWTVTSMVPTNRRDDHFITLTKSINPKYFPVGKTVIGKSINFFLEMRCPQVDFSKTKQKISSVPVGLRKYW